MNINEMNNKKIEIHMLVELNNNSINRGRNGELKSTTDANGVKKQYISSQCVKRSIRERKMQDPDNRQGVKVVYSEMVEKVHEVLLGIGITNEDEIKKITEYIIEAYGMKKNKQENNENNNENTKNKDQNKEKSIKDNILDHLSCCEIECVVKKLCEKNIWKDLDTIKKHETQIEKLVKNIKEIENDPKYQISYDIAMHGRMIASSPDLNIDGASFMTDLIGVTPMNSVYDFYSAKSDGDKQGAANMGDIEINSGIFYKTTVIDVNTLKKNLKNENDVIKMLTWDYLKDYVECIGKGRQHGKFNTTYPFYIAVVVTEGNGCTVRHSIFDGKHGADEMAKALHDNLMGRISNPNRSSDNMKIAESDETTGKYDNFNDFIRTNVIEA